MNELFRKRIERRLESLPDDLAYQVLDYIEFLEAKYGQGGTKPTPFEKLAEGVEDVLRAGKLPVAAVKGTMQVMESASRLMSRLAEASRAAAAELGKTVSQAGPEQGEPAAPSAPAPEPRTDAENSVP
ncbi:hypothetical protein HRbin33_01312 [bacterium HR33]|nr:hypothetical protein HRbin33_01312 [bacterium HR33]